MFWINLLLSNASLWINEEIIASLIPTTSQLNYAVHIACLLIEVVKWDEQNDTTHMPDPST